MSKALRDTVEKAEKLLAKHESELDEAIVVELRLALKTVSSLQDEHRGLKSSLKESGEVLEASARDLGKVLRRAKKVAYAAEKARQAAKLAEKAVAGSRKPSKV